MAAVLLALLLLAAVLSLIMTNTLNGCDAAAFQQHIYFRRSNTMFVPLVSDSCAMHSAAWPPNCVLFAGEEACLRGKGSEDRNKYL